MYLFVHFVSVDFLEVAVFVVVFPFILCCVSLVYFLSLSASSPPVFSFVPLFSSIFLIRSFLSSSAFLLVRSCLLLRFSRSFLSSSPFSISFLSSLPP